ncbi:hypothetical protein DRJ17_06300 [Candidatus Woesearchaeota archaeon]|nr:MAG: hypothetical protein DRJ17_06300 [Candidatus Woesearchaeota archaeon]
MKKIVCIVILATLMIPSAKALLMPIGIAGRILIDGNPTNNIVVNIKNLNTGETTTAYTRKAQNGEDGWFVCAIGGEDGHKIRATVNYGGETYVKDIIVNLNRTTHYINFSISTTSSSPPPPVPPSSSPPSANFVWSPENPRVNETITFIDVSSDPDGDIVSTNWRIDEQNFTGHSIQYTFTEAGNFTISLIVMDSKGYIDICQKTIYIAPLETSQEPPSDTNETTTSNQTEKTNITLFIEVKDKNGNPLSDTKVEIYQNDTLVQVVYTNNSGVAEVEVSSGSYEIKAFYGSQIETKRMDFVNDGRVTFLLNPEEKQQPEGESYNWWWLISIPIVVIVAIVLWKRRKPWWT